MDTRQQLEAAVDTLTRGQPQGQENEIADAILTLLRANPHEQQVQQFVTSFETKRGRPVS